jgi:hypothetical protein
MADDNPGNVALLEGIRMLTETLANVHRLPRQIRAPRFAEQRDIGEYLNDFRRVADINQWDDIEAGIELQSVLEGKALSVALTARTTSFQEICTILQERLALRPDQARDALHELQLTKDNIDEVANQVRRLTERGYGRDGFNLRQDLLEQEQVRAFLRTITSRDAGHWVNGHNPRTLEDAVMRTKAYFSFDEQYAPSKRVRTVTDNSSELLTAVRQLSTELLGLKSKSAKDAVTETQCSICKGHHFAIGCPFRQSKKPENQ